MTKSFKPIFTITNRITAGLTRIERARGFLEATTLSEAWAREMGVGARQPDHLGLRAPITGGQPAVFAAGLESHDSYGAVGFGRINQ